MPIKKKPVKTAPAMVSRPKTSLSFNDKIKAAYAYFITGATQQQIAVLLGVSNHGRVNEAIKEIEKALKD